MQTAIEKITQKFVVNNLANELVKSGDYVTIEPAYVMTHDNTGAVIPKFISIGAKQIYNPDQIVITLDHDIQNKSESNLTKYKKIEEFAKSNNTHFFPAGRGIGHQVLVEEGFVFPGRFVVASDSHSNMYGGIGCLGTPIVRTDAASIWATGKTWWQVPPIAKVIFTGKLNKGVSGKDVIIALCGIFNNDEVLNHGIEFSGEGVKCLSIEQRLTIANMTTEWGALVGLFPIDKVVINWVKNNYEKRKTENVRRETENEKRKTKDERCETGYWKSDIGSENIEDSYYKRVNAETILELERLSDELKADDNALYEKEITIDLSTISPFVSGPNSVIKMWSVNELRKQKIKIDKAYLLSCVNSRVEDIIAAAEIAKNKKFAEHVKFYLAAASSLVQKECEKNGSWQTLIDAGAIPLSPGCGPCIGLGVGLLEDNEVGISATNRNFKGRMGSPNAQAYLASPAVVATSAINGYISYDWNENIVEIKHSIILQDKNEAKSSETKLLIGFPKTISGEIIFCHQDNLNTDGIYPGKYTYNDEITPDEQAKVVMENYDPDFVKTATEGNILVGGFNFGTGSSREQAATAIKHKGIKIVIAGSFNETYKRNAINNGLLTIECPELVFDLKKNHGDKLLTVKTNLIAEINFASSKIFFNEKEYSISPVGSAAQELILFGSLEEKIKNSL